MRSLVRCGLAEVVQERLCQITDTPGSALCDDQCLQGRGRKVGDGTCCDLVVGTGTCMFIHRFTGTVVFADPFTRFECIGVIDTDRAAATPVFRGGAGVGEF